MVLFFNNKHIVWYFNAICWAIYLIIALFIISMILFAQNENKIIDKYKKWKKENLNDE